MSAAKLAANQANAQLSTGPRNTKNSRFNGMHHGLTSKQTVIPGESQEAYDSFRAGLFADLNPKSATEDMLAERVVGAAWRLLRFQRVEAAFFNDRVKAFLNDNPDADPDSALANLFVDPAETTRMRLFLRYQTSVQREYDKARIEFQRAQAEREQRAFEEAALAQARQNAAPMDFGFASQDSEDASLSASSWTQLPVASQDWSSPIQCAGREQTASGL
jgi:hypothetical protein